MSTPCLYKFGTYFTKECILHIGSSDVTWKNTSIIAELIWSCGCGPMRTWVTWTLKEWGTNTEVLLSCDIIIKVVVKWSLPKTKRFYLYKNLNLCWEKWKGEWGSGFKKWIFKHANISSSRTDCQFSPDDKMVLTGISIKKNEGVGKLMFFDRETFDVVTEMECSNSVSVISP